jgi:hypothetical protein
MITCPCKTNIQEFQLGGDTNVAQFIESWDTDPGTLSFLNSIEDDSPLLANRRILKEIVKQYITELETFTLIKCPEQMLNEIMWTFNQNFTDMMTPTSPIFWRSASRAASFRTRMPR